VSDGRVGRGCYARTLARMSAASRACPARGYTDERAALHRSRLPVDQSGKRVASWTGKSPDTPDTPSSTRGSSRGCRARLACRRGCHEDATRKRVPWNSSYTGLQRRVVCRFTPRSFRRYEVMLLADRGTRVRTTCPRLLLDSAAAGARPRDHLSHQSDALATGLSSHVDDRKCPKSCLGIVRLRA